MGVAEETAARISVLRTFKALEHRGDHGRFLAGGAFRAVVGN